MTALRIPQVHINGTSRLDLLGQMLAAARGLREAYALMAAAAPNQRDYYPMGPEAWEQAQAQHGARLTAVEGIRREYEELALAISDQGSGRR